MKLVNCQQIQQGLENLQRIVKLREYVLAFVFLALVTLGLHHSALNGFWRFDDGAHLLFAATYAPWQYFFLPSITILQSYANVAPYNAFFYDINLALFGMVPRWHYAHQIALLGCVAFATYRLVRLWQEPLIALMAALLFLAGLPTLYVAQQLMTGHYATGLLFTVLSLHCYTLSVRDGRFGMSLLGAGLYFLATTCKEVFVPLMLLLPFLPVGRLSERVKAMLPYIAVAIGYTAWRYAILGRLVGGYINVDMSHDEQLRQLFNIPLLLIGWAHSESSILSLTGQRGIKLAAFGGVVFIGFMASYRRRLSWAFILSAFTLLLLPLVPLTRFPGLNFADRYLFLVWWACAIFLAVLVSGFKSSRVERVLRLICFVFFVGVMLQAQRHEYRRIAPQLAMQDTLYRVALQGESTTAILLPPDRGYYKGVLSGARQASLQFFGVLINPVKLIVDGPSLCEFANAGYTIKSYDETCNCMKDVTHQLEESLARLNSFADGAVPGMPLNVVLSLDHQMLTWELGPYVDGNYSVLLDGMPTRLPAKGQISYVPSQPLRFRVQHEVKNGVIALSPQLDVNLAIHPSFAWSGVSEVVSQSCAAIEKSAPPKVN